MNLFPDVVFVGQGPNRSCWTRAIELGRRLRPNDPESFAIEVARRLSLTGRCGRTLAGLCDVDLQEFRSCYARRNLNTRWNGKSGRGDRFDAAEGTIEARRVNAEGFRRFVLLGSNVSRCFGFDHEPMRVLAWPSFPQSYLLFPHPSGVNAFWNSAANPRAARAVLRGFLELDEPRGNAPVPVPEAKIKASIRAVQEVACGVFGIGMAEMLSPSRREPLSSYRLAAMAAARDVTGASYPDIAHAFRRRHHSSAIRAAGVVEASCAANADLRAAVLKFREKFPILKSEKKENP